MKRANHRSAIARIAPRVPTNDYQGADSDPIMPGTQDPEFFINQAIDWLQLLTPDEYNNFGTINGVQYVFDGGCHPVTERLEQELRVRTRTRAVGG